MASLYDKLMAKDTSRVAPSPNSKQIGEAPMSLRSAMRKYAAGGNVAGPNEDAVPDYSRAYSALGGANTVNNLRNQFLESGLDEGTIGSIFSQYYAPEQPVQQMQTMQPAQQVQPMQQTVPTPIDTPINYGSDRVSNNIASSQPVSNNVLSGNIMAGASWNSLNPTLADELTNYTGQSTLNTAVGGATTEDTLKQLNDFLGSGGSFAPGSNVFLQTGGIDLVNGVDRNQVENNIDQIISQLENQGANVVLTGSPYAASFNDVQSNNFNPELDSIYENIAGKHKNVALVDSMGRILQDKSLLSDPIHPNQKGWGVYNQSVLDALKKFKG
jgi:lysophospholipase L1-like esterase